MTTSELARALVTGMISGYVGTRAMSPVTTKLEQMESQQDKQREKEASPGVAYDVAARKVAGALGINLDDKQVKTAGAAFHYGIGITAGLMYVMVRRTTSLGPFAAGLVTALVLWGGIDEGMNPLLGFSAPATAYPLATHLRGLAGHLALGLGTAVTAETLSAVYER